MKKAIKEVLKHVAKQADEIYEILLKIRTDNMQESHFKRIDIYAINRMSMSILDFKNDLREILEGGQ